MRPPTVATRFLVAALLISVGFGTLLSPAQAALPATPGRRCLDSLQLQSNLPFSDISRDGEIIDIDGFMTPLSGNVVGFIYTTRRGEHFMQVEGSNFEGASDALGNVGAMRLANAAKFARSPGVVFRMDEPEAVGVLANLRRRDQLYRCFSQPLSFSVAG
jgi:hypothetical protein